MKADGAGFELAVENARLERNGNASLLFARGVKLGKCCVVFEPFGTMTLFRLAVGYSHPIFIEK